MFLHLANSDFFILYILFGHKAGKGITYFSTDRERTADMVNSMHPNSSVSNCEKRRQIGAKKVGNLMSSWQNITEENDISHLLNMLLQNQLQVLDVIHCKTCYLKQKVVLSIKSRHSNIPQVGPNKNENAVEECLSDVKFLIFFKYETPHLCAASI